MSETTTLKELFSRPNYLELVEEKLRELATEQSDFIYAPKSNRSKFKPICSYYGPALYTDIGEIGPDCSGCIFGQAFQRLGVPATDLNSMQAIDIYIDYLHETFEIDNVPRCPVSWKLIQENQDEGKSWGEIIKLLDIVKTF